MWLYQITMPTVSLFLNSRLLHSRQKFVHFSDFVIDYPIGQRTCSKTFGETLEEAIL